ncbi:histidine triad nucleotide-binding protein [Gammaproteobacteria bacterium]|nr:histidine triad nucleotide-binding protein [Gammaproteobacteria bacterium]
MVEKSIFERIIDRELSANIVHEDELCIAFHDLDPQAPLHVLICPKKRINMISEALAEDLDVLGHLLLVASVVAAAEGYADAFRLTINNGSGAGQTVFHLHIHLMAGRPFSWPPG